MRRLLLMLAAAMAVSACVEPEGNGATKASFSAQGEAPQGFLASLFAPRAGLTPQASVRPPEAVALARGEVVVAGPAGYCIDTTTLRRSGGFAMLASCQMLSNGESGLQVAPVLITVTVSDATNDPLATAAALASAAESPLIDDASLRDLVLAHLESGGQSFLSEGDPRYWRGLFRQGRRLVSLALYAPEGSALAGAQGASLLTSVRDRIRELSPQGAATPSRG